MKREVKQTKALDLEKPKRAKSAQRDSAAQPTLKTNQSLVGRKVENKKSSSTKASAPTAQKIAATVARVAVKQNKSAANPAQKKNQAASPKQNLSAKTSQTVEKPVSVKAHKKSAPTTHDKTAAQGKVTAKVSAKTAAVSKPVHEKVKAKPRPKPQNIQPAQSKKTEKNQQAIVPNKTSKAETKKIATGKTLKTAAKIVKPKSAAKKIIEAKVKTPAPVKKEKTAARVKIVPAEKLKTREKQLVTKIKTKTAKMPAPEIKVNAPRAADKPLKKKIKPISSAVLRGKSGRYDFEVFPLDAEFEKIPAIYVISKRVTDKQKRGHHKFICIGQTDSISDDIKKHKKDKFIKANKANVVCLLKEQDEQNRVKIATDLREAHTIVCHHK